MTDSPHLTSQQPIVLPLWYWLWCCYLPALSWYPSLPVLSSVPHSMLQPPPCLPLTIFSYSPCPSVLHPSVLITFHSPDPFLVFCALCRAFLSVMSVCYLSLPFIFSHFPWHLTLLIATICVLAFTYIILSLSRTFLYFNATLIPLHLWSLHSCILHICDWNLKVIKNSKIWYYCIQHLMDYGIDNSTNSEYTMYSIL